MTCAPTDVKNNVLYISSVYSPFSDGVGLPLYNIPFPGVLMMSIGAELFLASFILDYTH